MRLATFNILHGRSLTDDRVDLDRFAAAIRTLDADVLALQEVDRDQPRSHGADLTAVAAEAMEAPEHRFVATLAGTPDLWGAPTGELQPSGSSYGIALLSRFPVLSWREFALPVLWGRVPMLFRGHRHPKWVRDEPRAALAAEIQTPEGLLTVASTHLTFLPGWNAIQLRRLVRNLQGVPRPVALMGDLNLDDARPTRITGWRSLAHALTYPAAHPTQQLDHILADGPIHPTGQGVAIDLGLSDHRALTVDVVFEPTAKDPTGRVRHTA